jgi:transcriptional regulator with XRE-family HTH domain
MQLKHIFKEIRKKTGLQQKDFAKKLNVCEQLISQYETGYRKTPSIDTAKRLMQIAKEVGHSISMDDIYT